MRAKTSWRQAANNRLYWIWGIGLLASALLLNAEDEVNPYLAIVDRNTFGLEPEPPPQAPPPPQPVEGPPANTVRLTGISSILSKTKVLFEITEPGSPEVHKPIMAVGDPAQFGVQVLAIDLAKNEVRIKNGNSETNVTFEAATMAAPTPTPPANRARLTAARNRLGARNLRSVSSRGTVPAPNPQATATVIGGTRRTSNNSRNNIVVSGGQSASLDAYMSSPAVPNTATPRVPPRPIRTPTTPNAAPMTREEAIIRLELQREINNATDPSLPPLPPTELSQQY